MTESSVVPETDQANLMSQIRYDRMNLLVLAGQSIVWALLLLAIEHTSHWLPQLVALSLFCLMMQGVFSMMHECFHDHGHRSLQINRAMSWYASTLFGASSTFIKVNHIGHHYRNRTEAEMVDYVAPDESRVSKTVFYYFAIVGGIWLGASLGSLFIALSPNSLLRKFQSIGATNTYGAALGDFTAQDFKTIRKEVLASIVFLGSVWWLLGLSWATVLIAYIAFAFSWSSLQWIYHVRTPLDVVEGTYNLRASSPVRWCLLNFNYNLTHHRDPGVRWQRLHQLSDLTETRPFWRTWISMVNPPEPLPDDPHFQKTYY